MSVEAQKKRPLFALQTPSGHSPPWHMAVVSGRPHNGLATLQVMARPSEFDVVVALNFYGSVVNSWLLAQVGGLGMSPSGSYNFQTGHAVFEASYGSAPRYAIKESECQWRQSFF
jgi:hypothetical protein